MPDHTDPQPAEPLFIGVEEFARRFSIGRSKAYELVHAGTVATVRLGTRRLIAMSEVERFADSLTTA